MAKRVNTLIKLRANRAATATERGNSLDPALYTKHVQQAQPNTCGVCPQQFNVPEEFEHELVATVRSSPKQKSTGPDGIANEMLQLCPELCGKVLFLLWKACGHLAYIPTSWREGTLCPLHKKGSYHDPDNYRGLTLLSHARKTISATINRLVMRYTIFHKYQHGFTKYNGTEQAIVEVSNTILNSHKFIAVLDLIKAYDRVSRSLLSAVCQQRLKEEHLNMTALLLQPLTVQTSKDITKSSATVTIGVPQGESFSCTLFNIFQDTLLEKLSSVPCHISDKAASALADDVIVMSKTAEGLQLLLDTCTKWAAEYRMAWNTAPGKSEVLLPPRGHQTSTFSLSGEQLRNVESSVYLGVSLTASGVTEGKHIMRVKSAQRRLMQLSPIGIHIRGFDTNLCVMLYRVFVRSIYEYCLHLVPLTLSLKLAISRLESCFFRLVLGKVASRFGSSRLPRLRSLCRLESVDLRRIIMGQQRLSYYQDRRRAALQLPKTNPSRLKNVRSACEQLTMFVGHPSIMRMRNSIDSLADSSKSMFRKKEWKKACSNKRRPVPETSGRLLPPVLRLQNRHHRLLGVRWYFGEFPKQPTLVRERLESRGYMVDKLRELMLLGNLSPQQKIELDMVLETISRIVMSI